MIELVGGSADLTPSNLTDYPGVVDFQEGSYEGRYIRFGVREHAMVAAANGLFAYGGFRYDFLQFIANYYFQNATPSHIIFPLNFGEDPIAPLS
jgi:transketolase